MKEIRPEYNLSPRFIKNGYATASAGRKETDTSMMLIDTEREKSIGLGTAYPFPPQKEAECLVSNDT